MEKIYIYDRSGVLVNDPEKSVDFATNLYWDSYWPKGHGDCSFVVSRNIARDWVIKSAYEIIVRDGSTILYQGILDAPQNALKGINERTTVHASGFYSLLHQRKIRKRWVDNAAISRLVTPETEYEKPEQYRTDVDTKDNFFKFRSGYDDVGRTTTDKFIVDYIGPPNTVITRITFNGFVRTGEGLSAQIWNTDQDAEEKEFEFINKIEAPIDPVDLTFTQGDTPSFQIRFGFLKNDEYDQNDYLAIRDMHVFYDMPNSAERYTATEILKDVLDIEGDDLTIEVNRIVDTDYDLASLPGTAVGGVLGSGAFITKDDGYETADSIIQRLASFGDEDGNTYGFSVWDEGLSTDGKPAVVFEIKPTITKTVSNPQPYEWQAHIKDFESFSDEETLDALYNWIIVKYTDTLGRIQYATPDTQSTLKNDTSITAYGKRASPVIDIGESSSEKALIYGERYLSYHENPSKRTNFSIKGFVKNKAGIETPANRVRAGHRILVHDYNDGEIFFMRKVSYDAETKVLSIEPELAVEDITQQDTVEVFRNK